MDRSSLLRRIQGFLRGHLPLFLTILGGTSVSVVAFILLFQSERAKLRDDFQSLAADRAQAIRAGLAEDTVELGLLGAYFEAANELGENRLDTLAVEFQRLVEGISLKESDSLAIALALRVQAGERAVFERRGKRELAADFGVKDQGSGGEPVPAGEREEYFPVAIAEPRKMGAAVVGLDLFGVPQFREAIRTADAGGVITAAGQTDVSALQGDRSATWFFKPLYRTPRAMGKGDLVGVAAYVFRIDLMVENSLKDLNPVGIDLELMDPAAPSERNPIYYHRSRTSKPDDPPARGSTLSWRTSIDMGQRTLTLAAYPTPAFTMGHRTLQSWTLLFGGLALTAFAAISVSERMRRAAGIERLVAERTADLSREVSIHMRLENELKESEVELSGRVEELDRRNREIGLLNETGDLLQACVSTVEAFPIVSRYMPRLLPGTSGALYMYDAARGHLGEEAHWGERPPAISAFAPEDCWALRRGRIHSVNESSPEIACPHSPSGWEPGSICVPLMGMGETVGLFHATALREEGYPFAVSVGEHTGLALSNLKLRSDLKRLSIHDPLTELYNRRYMEEALELELRRAGRKGASVGIIMLDIDHFKGFNDRFGHAAGDELLRALGGVLRTHMRAGDIACRFGGEEFTLILPEASLEATMGRAEDLRGEVKRLDVLQQGRPLGPVTISLGVAAYPTHGGSGDAVLQAADSALYKAKEAGRDRTVTAEGKP